MGRTSSAGKSAKSVKKTATKTPAAEKGPETPKNVTLKPVKSQTLTLQQQRFCREYVKDFNGTRAAIRAGYSERTAQEQSSRLLSNVKVCQFLGTLLDELTVGLEIDADSVLKGLSEIARNSREPASARVRAWELLGKYFSLWGDPFSGQINNEGGVILIMPAEGR